MPWHLSWLNLWDTCFICDFVDILWCRGKFRRHVWTAGRLSLKWTIWTIMSSHIHAGKHYNLIGPFIWPSAWLITKTCLYNFDPLKPHFYIVKLGFTGVYIIFLISAQKNRGGSNEYLQSMFWAEIWKISEFFTRIFFIFGGEILYIFE